MSDDRPHMAALITALNAELTPREAFARGTVPEEEPAIYVVVDIERRGGAAPLRNVRTARRSHRVTVRGVGRTVKEAQWALAEASSALEGATLTVSGGTTTPLVFESAEGVSEDEGRYSGALTWTYGT